LSGDQLGGERPATGRSSSSDLALNINKNFNSAQLKRDDVPPASYSDREGIADDRVILMNKPAKEPITEAKRTQSEYLVKKDAKISKLHRPKSPPDSGYDTGGSATDAKESKKRWRAAGIEGDAASLLSVLSEAAENL
jgi:hypothetical protein